MNFSYDKAWDCVYGDIQHFGPTHKHLHRIYADVLKEIHYKSVLDVGCGPGDNLPLLLEGRQVERIAGVDISSKAITQAKEKYNGVFVVLDIQKQHLDSQYDLVFCSLVMEHVPDDEATLMNIFKMTGRYLLLGTVAGNYEKYKAWEQLMGHVRNYLPGELEGKVRRAGFNIVKVIYWGYPFYSPISRVLLNINPKVGVGKYNPATRVMATLLDWLYFLNSSKRGDIVIVLASVNEY